MVDHLFIKNALYVPVVICCLYGEQIQYWQLFGPIKYPYAQDLSHVFSLGTHGFVN